MKPAEGIHGVTTAVRPVIGFCSKQGILILKRNTLGNRLLLLYTQTFLYLIPIAAFNQKAFYIPNALLIPLHDKEKELAVSIGKGTGYDLNLSYVVYSQFIVFGTGTVNKGTKKRIGLYGDRYNIVKDDNAVTFGLGLFRKQNDRRKIFETYAGFGKFKVNNNWYLAADPNASYTQAHYWNLFWQFSWGIKKEKLEVGYGGRLAYFRYKDILFYDDYPSVQNHSSRYENANGVNFEPAFSLAYPVKAIFINIQMGYSIPLYKGNVKRVSTFTTTVVESKMTETISAAFARISLQHDIDLSRKGRIK